jgi:hypothetical protein
MADPRLGYRDGSNVITTYPTQYADGTAFDRTANPTFTFLFFDVNNFAVLQVGTETISTTLYDALALAAGSGASGVQFDDFAGLLQNLGLTDVDDIDVSVFDDFDGSALSSEWNTDLGSTGSAPISSIATEDALTLITGADDESFATLSRRLIYPVSASLNLVEARLKLSAITDVVFEFGFSDALSETLGLAFSSHDATPVAVADEAAVFAWHAEDTGVGEISTNLEIVTAKATVAARVVTTTPLVADTYIKLGVALDSDGDAAFYINEVFIASVEEALTTSADLTPWVSVVAKEAATSRTVTIDWIRASSTRS